MASPKQLCNDEEILLVPKELVSFPLGFVLDAGKVAIKGVFIEHPPCFVRLINDYIDDN